MAAAKQDFDPNRPDLLAIYLGQMMHKFESSEFGPPAQHSALLGEMSKLRDAMIQCAVDQKVICVGGCQQTLDLARGVIPVSNKDIRYIAWLAMPKVRQWLGQVRAFAQRIGQRRSICIHIQEKAIVCVPRENIYSTENSNAIADFQNYNPSTELPVVVQPCIVAGGNCVQTTNIVRLKCNQSCKPVDPKLNPAAEIGAILSVPRVGHPKGSLHGGQTCNNLGCSKIPTPPERRHCNCPDGRHLYCSNKCRKKNKRAHEYKFREHNQVLSPEHARVLELARNRSFRQKQLARAGLTETKDQLRRDGIIPQKPRNCVAPPGGPQFNRDAARRRDKRLRQKKNKRLKELKTKLNAHLQNQLRDRQKQ